LRWNGSKRYGDASYEDFINRGYLKEAILNYIALLGWNPRSEREIFSLDELRQAFDVEGINKSPAIFDPAKLTWMNAEYIHQMDEPRFTEAAMPYYKQALEPNMAQCGVLYRMLKPRTEVFAEIPKKIAFLKALPDYETDLFEHKKMKTTRDIALQALIQAKEALAMTSEWDEEAIHQALMRTAESLSFKTGQVFWPVRIALTGLAVSPGGADEAAALLGREEALRRIGVGIEKLTRTGAGT